MVGIDGYTGVGKTALLKNFSKINLGTNPNSYFRLVIIALKRYRKLYKPDKITDLLVEV